jgi:hypothetical protein
MARYADGWYLQDSVGAWLEAKRMPRLAKIQHMMIPMAMSPESGRMRQNAGLHGRDLCAEALGGLELPPGESKDAISTFVPNLCS